MKPLSGSDEWQSLTGTCSARTHFDGAISIDEMQFPAKCVVRDVGAVVRPVEKEWTIYWVSSTTMELQPPVRGRWSGRQSCWMTGEEESTAGRSWSATRGRTSRERPRTGSSPSQRTAARPGKSTGRWTSPAATTEPPRVDIPKLTSDFDFLVGELGHAQPPPQAGPGRAGRVVRDGVPKMKVHATSTAPISFDEGWFPTEGFRGATLRLYNPSSKTWSIHWINSQRGKLETPVIGSFSPDGIGIFEAPEPWNGQDIIVRFTWTPGTTQASWEQSFSPDNGQTWHPNWQMTHTRTN